MNRTLASRAFMPSRSLCTSSVRLLRPRTSTRTSASQPVLQKNAPPPPTRRSPVQSPPPQPQPGKRGGKEGSVYASYRALPYNTKLVFWTCGASKSPPPFSLSLSACKVDSDASVGMQCLPGSDCWQRTNSSNSSLRATTDPPNPSRMHSPNSSTTNRVYLPSRSSIVTPTAHNAQHEMETA